MAKAGLLVGAAAVAGTAALLNPKIRKKAKQTADDAISKAQHLASDPGETVEKMRTEFENFISEVDFSTLGSDLQTKVQELREQFESVIGAGKNSDVQSRKDLEERVVAVKAEMGKPKSKSTRSSTTTKVKEERAN